MVSTSAQNDKSCMEAKAKFGKGFIVGVSCTDSLLQYKIAENQKADYVAFGPMYKTFSKRKKKIDNDKIFDLLKKLRLPFTLIGGINHSNFMELVKFKPHNIAIISSIWNFHKGPIESAIIYNSIIKEGSHR